MKTFSIFLSLIFLLFGECLALNGQIVTPVIVDFDYSSSNDMYALVYSDFATNIISASTGEVIHRIEPPVFKHNSFGMVFVSQVVFSSDGEKLAISFKGDDSGGLIRVIDIETGLLEYEFSPGPSVNAIDWSPDGKLLSAIYVYNPSTRSSGFLSVWNAETGELVNETYLGETSPLSLDWHPTEPLVAFTTREKVVIWDVEKWEASQTITVDEIGATSVAWSPTGDKFASAGAEHILKIWDTETGNLTSEIEIRNNGEIFPEVFWSPRGEMVGVTLENRVQIWDAETGIEEFSSETTGLITGLGFNEEGKLFYVPQDMEIQETTFSVDEK